MNAEETNATLDKVLKQLEELSSANIETRMKKAAEESIAAWEKRRAAFLGIVLAVFGIASYSAVRDHVADYFASSAYKQIDSQIMLKTAGISNQDPVAAIRTQLSDLGRRVEALEKPKAAPIPAPAPVSNGYVFVGVRDSSGQWTQKNFEIVGAGDRPPQPGDKLRATTSVNVRAGYIAYTDSGWVNKPSTGVLRPGDTVRVDESREVVSGFWWVAFTRTDAN